MQHTMKAVWFFAFPTTTTSILRSSFSILRASTSSSRSCSTLSMSSKNFVVDEFCFRQFSEHEEASKSYGGTVFTQHTVKQFEDIVNEKFHEGGGDDLLSLKDGYAPFCKHLFLPNDFTDAKVNVLPITKDNEHLVRTRYEARNDKELPVLQRFIPLELIDGGTDSLPVAKYLDLILYSREQIQKENESMGKQKGDETAPWGIVSIKAQDVPYELPMNPITVMRNSLGKDQGGSGVPLSRDSYIE